MVTNLTHMRDAYWPKYLQFVYKNINDTNYFLISSKHTPIHQFIN
jgi:hypothetical protein